MAVPNKSTQPAFHARKIFVCFECLFECLFVFFVLNAYDILYLLQGSQWDRNHQNSHQSRVPDLKGWDLRTRRLFFFGNTVPRKSSPWRCRLRLPKTIGKYSLNVMCCNKLSIENQRWQDGGIIALHEVKDDG